jgi:hypothetical protein
MIYIFMIYHIKSIQYGTKFFMCVVILNGTINVVTFSHKVGQTLKYLT